MVIDVGSQIGAVQREVRTGERDGQLTRVVVAAQTYDTDVADLWDAITNGERIPRWFLPISGDLRLGGTYQLEGNAGGDIETCDAPHHLGVTWMFGGFVSWLDVRLTALDGGRSQLELEHTAHVPEEMWATFGPGATGVGWDLALMGLAQHLGSGAPAVEPANAMAWMVSDEGRAFMTESGEAWYVAHVASGADEAAARAAADGTLAAYTAAPPEATPVESDATS